MRKALLLVTVLTAACVNRTPGAESVLADTASNLKEIRSGEIDFELVSSLEGGEGPVGFSIRGPFQLGEEGRLPVVQLAYSQKAGARNETVEFLSNGEDGFVEVDEVYYRLPPDRLERMRAAGGAEPASAVEQVRIDSWIERAEMTEEGDASRIRADLDPVRAINGLIEIAGRVGAGTLPGIEAEGDQETLRRAVSEASMEVLTGRDDRLLRDLRLTLRFEPADLPEGLRLRPVSLQLNLSIENPNQTVRVETPADPRPFAELPAG